VELCCGLLDVNYCDDETDMLESPADVLPKKTNFYALRKVAVYFCHRLQNEFAIYLEILEIPEKSEVRNKTRQDHAGFSNCDNPSKMRSFWIYSPT